MMRPRQLILMAGAVAVLTPLLTAYLAGAAAGLAVSLLLTLALLAAGWRLVDLTTRKPPTPRPPPPHAGAGELARESNPSGGAEDTLLIPEDSPSPARGSGGRGVGGAPRVLLVEDDPVSRRVVLRMLQRLGVVADHVADGQAAVEAVAARQYALTLMDCQLPVLDGYAAAATIRQQEAARPEAGGLPAGRLPIVALTASNLDADRDRCSAAGMDDFLTKPLDLTRLSETLARWNVPHQSPVASTPPLPADAPPILDPAGLPLVDGRLPEPYQEIVQLFQQEAARRMDALTQAAVQAEYPLLARIAHTLAGSASSIGATRLASASAALEALAKQPHENGLGDIPISEAIEEVRRALHELEIVLARLTAAR